MPVDTVPRFLRSLAASVLGAVACGPVLGQAGAIAVGVFAAQAGEPPAPWRVIQLSAQVAPTEYKTRLWDGVAAMQAQADSSMALLARPLEVALQATPVLCWRWRVQGVVKSANLATRAGDDYAARVYVAFRLPPGQLGLGLRAKLALARSLYGEHVPDAALNYVWDNQHPVGTRRPNAYTDRTQMIVQRSGEQQAGHWVTERVNVLDDVWQAFGTRQVKAHLLAVASDTDNTGERAQAGFADLHFVEPEAPCQFPPLLKTP